MCFAGMSIVGCGASGSDGSDDSDGGAFRWPSGSPGDGGKTGNGGSSASSDGGSSTGASDGSTSTIDSGSSSTTTDASTTTGAYCSVAPAGGFVGGPSQMTTFTGTATETSPIAGSAQTFTLTITGDGVNLCWGYDRCNAYVDMTTNLWGNIGSAASEESTFSVGVGGGDMQIIPDEGASGSLLLRAKPRSTQFIGTYSASSVTYSITVDAPSSIVPCTAVPNCSFEGTTGNYCGLSIDGYTDTIYHCVGSNPATVVQICPIGCGAASTGGVECIE